MFSFTNGVFLKYNKGNGLCDISIMIMLRASNVKLVRRVWLFVACYIPQNIMNKQRFEKPRRVVVKVGSSSLSGQTGDLNYELISALIDQINWLQAQNTQVILVSSGAVAAGMPYLDLKAGSAKTIPWLQSAASIGQGILTYTYQTGFARHQITSGQILLTADDFMDRSRYLNARNTLESLLAIRAVPIVNENDTVATEELSFGDNDRLAALVSIMVKADLLLLLTDVAGLLDSQGDVIHRVDQIDQLYDSLVDYKPGSKVGRGGMGSKLESARVATYGGVNTVIAQASQPDVIKTVASGDYKIGSWLPAATKLSDSKKMWIAFARSPKGEVTVDAGAKQALLNRGSSLLPAGVRRLSGAFEVDDSIDIKDLDGAIIARGLARVSHKDLTQSIAAQPADASKPVVHRDHMVLFKPNV